MWGAAIGAAITATQMYLQHREEMRERRRERAMQKKRASLAWRRSQAIKAGYHPLAALGIDMQLPEAQAVGTSAREFARYSGQAVGEAIDAYEDADTKEIKKLAKTEMEGRAMQEYYGGLEAKRNYEIGIGNADIQSRRGIVLPGQGDAYKGSEETATRINTLDGQKDSAVVSGDWWSGLGISEGVIPLHQWNWREDDTVGMALTEEFRDSMEDDLGFKMSEYYYRAKKWLKGVAMSRADVAMQKKFYAYWRPRLPQVKGYYWEHLPFENRWKLMPGVKRWPVSKEEDKAGGVTERLFKEMEYFKRTGKTHWDPERR